MVNFINNFCFQKSMNRYPMLQGVDEERVFQIGGKAAILEEIVRRCPEANIPQFWLYDTARIELTLGNGKRIFRASSELDILGGFGLQTTVASVGFSNYEEALDRIKNPREHEKEKLQRFARSIGREEREPFVISQLQSEPDYYVVAMQHPNNPDVILVNYASGPSWERVTISSIEMRRDTPLTARVDTSGAIKGSANADLAKLASITYLQIQDLGIVHEDWVSIFEGGLYSDGRIETYQFTPLRRRIQGKAEIPEDKLVFGACKPIQLPVVNIPTPVMIMSFLKGGNYLDDYPDFLKFVEKRNTVADTIRFMPETYRPEVLNWMYVEEIEERYPDGYIAVTLEEPMHNYDITMRNAKAILFSTLGDDPYHVVSHNVSRAVYKVPVFVAGQLYPQIPTGEIVTFECDGSNYSLK